MKKYAFGLLAVALAVGFSSFTSKRLPDTWYLYLGTDNSSAFNPQSYDLKDAEPSNPSGLAIVNAIKVDATTEVYTSGTNQDFPKVDVIGSALKADITTAIANGAETPGRITLK